MVSKLTFILLTSATAARLFSASAQSAAIPNGLRDESTSVRAQTADSAKPASVVTPEMRGDIFMARKMYREAAEVYKEGPKSAVLLNKTAIAYHQMLELGMAERYYRLAIKVDSHYAEAINNLGTVYYARKGFRRAIGQYKKALRLNPQSASFWSNLGVGYFARKDYKRAADAWQEALTLDPNVFETRGTQGVLLQERSVEERAKFHYSLAQMYAKKGMNDRALLYIRRALEEGFKERKKIEEDPAFAALKDLPEFKELMAAEPRVL